MDFYEPNEDTYFLIDILNEDLDFLQHKIILELGCGSGLISQSLSSTNFKILFDINYKALLNINVKYSLINCDLLKNINQSFIDVIIFNPPYVPDNVYLDECINYACNGGVNGSEIINEFINQVNVNCFYLLFISANKPKEILDRIVKRMYKIEKINTKKILGELLLVVKCIKNKI